MDQDHQARRGRRLRRGLAATLAALAFTGLGVAGGYVWSERRSATVVAARGVGPVGSGPAPTVRAPMSGMPGMPTDKPATPAEDSKKSEPVEVTLTPEA